MEKERIEYLIEQELYLMEKATTFPVFSELTKSIQKRVIEFP